MKKPKYMVVHAEATQIRSMTAHIIDSDTGVTLCGRNTRDGKARWTSRFATGNLMSLTEAKDGCKVCRQKRDNLPDS